MEPQVTPRVTFEQELQALAALSFSGPFCLVEPRVACPECSLFVESVMGIRGPYWHGREQAELRLSYRTDAARDGAVTVSGAFFDLFRDNTCLRWLDHLADQDDLCAHTSELPAWVARLLKKVDFGQKVGRDAATRAAAAVLGIGVRSAYRGVARRSPGRGKPNK